MIVATRKMWKNTAITHPDDGGQPDGLHWLMLDEAAKYSYVCGFVEGLFQGHCFTTWGAPGLESNDACHSGEIRSFDFHWDKFVAKQTYGKFVEGLDKFYADERNSKIEIQHGLWVVMNILSGASGENLQMMVDAWRQKDGQNNEST